MIAASPYEMDTVKARFSELERNFAKVLKIDEFIERKATEKKAKEEA